MTTTALRPTAPSAPRAASVGLVLGGILSQQVGAAVASMVFPLAGPLGVVALRLTISALVMLAVCRPSVRGYRRADWAVVVLFGVALAVMNMLFYQAIARIPLGAAVTLEVLGPLVLSVVTSRRASSWLWAGLALVGVALLGRGGFDGLDPVGTAFALGAGALWAAYIVCSARTGSRFPKADGLALAMAVSAVISLPLGLSGALFHPVTLALGAVVALLSSALPYTLELLSLRTLRQSTFAILMSLAPAVAALAGYAVLGQDLAWPDVAAIVLVVVAGIGAVRGSGR
ncbi:EamA family transporter [Umezawaea sp. Da 62-37]|uniref:EamA family transporter n=1 Tax=Umezawaea sp. Da 62-37 TaxID=3075927 RepID=UPI0028F71471|nr:EamA family transporter [Umezawaea sp. Da 62-37]WNV86546.1 EamA family transporter [Umezawaea sp. Da 62-37]